MEGLRCWSGKLEGIEGHRAKRARGGAYGAASAAGGGKHTVAPALTSSSLPAVPSPLRRYQTRSSSTSSATVTSPFMAPPNVVGWPFFAPAG